MDQSVVSGIGNVYRAELLFRARLDPHKPGKDVPEDTARALWRDWTKLLRIGVKTGQMMTMDGLSAKKYEAALANREDRHWVYHRDRRAVPRLRNAHRDGNGCGQEAVLLPGRPGLKRPTIRAVEDSSSMRYTPHYILKDEDEVKRLIRENPWATIISNTEKGLVASHYPVMLEEDRPGISIVSHVGRPDERNHELGHHEVLVIIAGAHGYISPGWYENSSSCPPGTTRPPTCTARRRS